MERAIFIPLRTRSSMSALNLPTSRDSTRTSNNFILNSLNDGLRREGNGIGINRPRINVSSFFMELTYSAAAPAAMHLLKTSAIEGQNRRLEIHAANTINIIKHYCPAKPHKLNQYRCCARTQRVDAFKFSSIMDKPLEALDPTQFKCRTKVLVIIRDDTSGKWNSPFTSYLLGSLAKRHLDPLCITFQSETLLNTLVEQLTISDDLHVFSKNTNTNDPAFNAQAKRILVMSTLAKLIEKWSAPLIILDSCLSKLIALDEVVEFCKRCQIKMIDVDSSIALGRGSKQRKSEAKRIGHQVRKAMIDSNMSRIGGDLKRLQLDKTLAEMQQETTPRQMIDVFDTSLINEDCRRIVFNLCEKMNTSLEYEKLLQYDRNAAPGQLALSTQISLLEDGILADIENTDAFKFSRNLLSPMSGCAESARSVGEREEIRPKTGNSMSDEDQLNLRPFTTAHFSTALVRRKEKFSELLFNELNQRWRIHGPQRFIPRTADAGPYCSGMTDSEKQLLLTILQEVSYFETLKDIRNELKDSKKDLEGRLYGYNPDFANLIASAEEFLHGKASCMEPCKDEMQFYKMPVSLVMSEAEVKYLRSKPPAYVVGQESPNQLIRVAIEESTKLFTDAILHTACGARRLSSSKRNKTKVIVVIEDNNEALELLTVALWFFEKTPLATFQSKYYYNSAEFLLSLDACRFYFRSYLTHMTKRDEEHLFERWLGVGMNGVLRSYQHKIILIDFPRPGTNLQSSKTILINRLKKEEKLNNIKSFIIGKPTRKEDNLSSVEKLMDEIQSALDPRDKLLFRKSRRMYMDLKLYKQIEQKSRQDLKALRDWGLPEPENEHELWEKLRNSELVINNPLLSREQGTRGDESLLESETVNMENCYSYEDTSEPESTIADKSEKSKKSNSEDINFLSECEESLESITVGEENSSFTDDIQPYFTALQYHANRNGTLESTSVDAVDLQESDNEILDVTSTGRSNIELTATCDANVETPTSIDGSVLRKLLPQHSYSVNKTKLHEVDDATKNNISPPTLRRSAGVLNLLDKHSFTKDKTSFWEAKEGSGNVQRCRIMDSEVQSGAFTKLEFTLPPKQTSDEAPSTCSSVSRLAKWHQEKEKKIKQKKSFCVGNSCVVDESNDSHTKSHKNEDVKSSNRKGLPNLCLTYISKWGKSLSRALRKRKPPRSFPEQLASPLRSLSANNNPRIALSNQYDEGSSLENVANNLGDEHKQSSQDLRCDKHPTSNQHWFNNVMNHFRSKHTRTISRNRNSTAN